MQESKSVGKWESRGKYSGAKCHLSGEECQSLLNWHKERKLGGTTNSSNEWAAEFIKSMAKAIKKLMIDNPDLLQDRTEEQIAAALQKDKDKIEAQQQAMKSKKDWKKVK